MSTDTTPGPDAATAAETFQISPEAAELYEAQFVPAIFAEWAPRLIAFADVRPGDRVADIACGTGVVARHAAGIVDASRVVGVDLNQAMLDVAAGIAPDITWRLGDVVDLPLDDDAVDVAVCQMAAMFFPDRRAAVAEMARVARRRVAVLVPAAIEDQPAYRVFSEIVTRHAGRSGAALVGAYWSAGDPDHLRRLIADAGLHDVALETVVGTATFDSVDHLVATEVEGSPLLDRIDQATYDDIRRDCRHELAPFTTEDGRCEAPLVCHLVRGQHT